MNGTEGIVYLANLGPAGAVKDADSTFWCDAAQCSTGIDLKRVSASALATYFNQKLTPAAPLKFVGTQLTLVYDPTTLAVHNGVLTVIGGGTTPPTPGGGGAISTPGGGAVDSPGGGAIDTPAGGTTPASAGGGAISSPGGGAVDTPGAGAVDSPAGGVVTALLEQIAMLEARIAALEGTTQ